MVGEKDRIKGLLSHFIFLQQLTYLIVTFYLRALNYRDLEHQISTLEEKTVYLESRIEELKGVTSFDKTDIYPTRRKTDENYPMNAQYQIPTKRLRTGARHKTIKNINTSEPCVVIDITKDEVKPVIDLTNDVELTKTIYPVAHSTGKSDGLFVS